MVRRSSRRRTSTKSYAEPSENDLDGPDDNNTNINGNIEIKVEDDDDDSEEFKAPISIENDNEDNDDDDAASITSDEPPPKRRKKGRPKGTKSKPKSKSPSPKKDRDYGPVKDRTCPFCNKVFSIITGLAYHIEHRVCQKEKRRVTKSIPNPILEPGEKFVTPFGVVQVVKDDRAGEDYGNTKFGKELKDLRKTYNRKKEQLNSRRKKVHMFVGKRNRLRREALSKLYHKLNNGSCSLAEYSKDVFHEYYTPATPKHIFSGTYLKSQEHALLPCGMPNYYGPNPAIPADSYPGRVVECILFKDDRKVVTDIGDELEGRLSQVDVAVALVEKTQRKLKRGRKEMDKVENTAIPKNEGGMTLFLRRDLLMEQYNPALPVYSCVKCGKHFSSRSGYKYHIDQKSCFHERENFRKNRSAHLEEVEEVLKLNVLKIKAPSWLLPPLKAAPGETKKRKRCKKLPGWIVFDPTLSTIYPQTFKHLKLRRGSNNTKFMLKKWNAMGPGRKKIRKSRAKSNSVKSVVSDVSDWMDISNLPVYPAVMALLFPEIGNQRPSRRAASKNAMKNVSNYKNGMYSNRIKDEDYNPEEDLVDPEADAFLPSEDYIDVDAPMPALPAVAPRSKVMNINNDNMLSTNVISHENGLVETSVNPPPKKRKRKKNTDASVPSKPAGPVIVDIRPLVEEVRAGRYPSMKVYNGEHINICFHCKTQGDDVFYCEFCPNAEHIGCCKSKVTIRDLEADDEFMCHRCIQTVLSRRARAERRRLDKLNDAVKSKSGVPSTGVSLEQAKNAAALKREVIWSQSEFDQHISTYSKCPTGGPGGLICCGPCTASYSRFLSETAKEMEVQTLSGVGREVSELLELLNDAQFRLKQALDVSTGNDIKRSMLRRDQVEEEESGHNNNRFGISTSLMGILDIAGGGSK